MCGIIGQFGGKIDKAEFIKARDVLINRGPNDEGIYCDEAAGMALGHRRLSIIDLSPAGHQPMMSPDGRYVIIFNGEIFNFIEIRKEIPEYHFKSNTDTEVLLAAYQKWGKDCLNKLNGQFAFAIYDSRNRELFCARDRVGIKPFYYKIQNNIFYFASEIKALLALVDHHPSPNHRTIFEYLRYGFYDHNENTFFSGIKRLLPGQYAIYKDGKLELDSYWDLGSMASRESQYDGLSKEDATDLFKNLMSDALRFQFRSDVPVGLNLSGGLDSMSLLFFANKIMGGDFRLFSGGLDDEVYDETRNLFKVLSPRQQSLLSISNLTPGKAWSLKDKLLQIQDEPYGGLSTVHYFNLYEETKIAGVTVLLEGQGMDEILAGYKYYRQINSGLPQNLSQDMTKEGAPGALSRDFASQYAGDLLDFPKPFRSPLLNMQYRDIRYTKIPRVLRFNDHISMAYGKELRVPYLDHNLVEFCFFLPERLKIEGDQGKALFRRAMDGVIPDITKLRPKVTFGAFQTDWLRRYFQKEVLEIIDSDSFKNRPYWDYSQVKENVSRFFAGEGDNSFFLWQWINLELWLRRYF